MPPWTVDGFSVSEVSTGGAGGGCRPPGTANLATSRSYGAPPTEVAPATIRSPAGSTVMEVRMSLEAFW